MGGLVPIGSNWLHNSFEGFQLAFQNKLQDINDTKLAKGPKAALTWRTLRKEVTCIHRDK